MNTINKEVEISSVSLMSGLDSTAKLVPSDKKGIRFHFAGQVVDASVGTLLSTEHCTVIGNQDVKIVLIEHFMAACAICDIDAIDVYLSHYELPILNGGSKEWVDLFHKVGVKKDSEVKSYTITEPVSYINGKTHLVVIPSDKFSVTYGVNFNHPDLKQRWVSLDMDNLSEVIEARTFGYLKELEMMQKAGFGRGAKIENTLGLTDDGYTSELKSEFEPAKHKILDLIGDFRLTGFNPLKFKAEVIVKEAGHTVHTIVAKLLKDKIIEEK